MTDAEPKKIDRHKVAIVVIIAVCIAFSALTWATSNTTIQTTITKKWTDGLNGVHFLEIEADGGILALPVSEKTYQALDVGDCVLVTKSTVWGTTAGYSIKRGCP